MFKHAAPSAAGYEKSFIRQALLNDGLRLDGRGPRDYRGVNIKMSRTETSSLCEVAIGETLITSSCTGEIVSPFPDRPSEGFLLFSTDISETRTITHTEISRYLERTIRHSDALDMESLCIIGGEKVWQVKVHVYVQDTSGGNILDCCMLAAMGALKAFRRPDISILSVPVGQALASKIVMHHSDDREPLPLALQHTPLALTLGIFRRSQMVTTLAGSEAKAASHGETFVFVLDPCRAEEAAMDGELTFSMNSYKEICSVSKPGGVSLPATILLEAAALCAQHIVTLHTALQQALSRLDDEVVRSRKMREDVLRRFGGVRSESQTQVMEVEESSSHGVQGVDRNDPILQWANLHQAASLREK